MDPPILGGASGKRSFVRKIVNLDEQKPEAEHPTHALLGCPGNASHIRITLFPAVALVCTPTLASPCSAVSQKLKNTQKVALVIDPEGNEAELWQPPAGQ
jgi:hypothetical protein